MLKIRILLFYVLSIPIIVHAQDYEKIDSLKNAVALSSGIAKAKVLNKLGWEYRLSDPDSTIYYCNQGKKIAQDAQDYVTVSSALNFIGVANGYKGAYSEAFDNYSKAIEISLEHGDTLNLAHARNSLGRLLFSQGDLINSYEYFFTALNLFKEIKDTKGMGYCFKSLSELYKVQGSYEKALLMSLEALTIRKKLNNKRGQISIYQEIADIYLLQSQFSKSLEYLDKAQQIAVELNDKVSLVEIFLGISDILYHQGKPEAALDFALRAVDPMLDINNQTLSNRIHLQLGKIYYALGDMIKSESYLLKVINSPSESEILATLSDAHLFLSKVKERQNDHPQALELLKKYNQLSDSLNSIDNAREIERLELRLELQEKEQENKLLKVKQAAVQAEVDTQKTRNLALSVAILLVLIVVVFIVRYTRQKVKSGFILSKKNEQIEVQNKKIREQYKGLEIRNSELAELNREKDNLMNIVAHDLRSPLNNIKGIAELIRLSGTLNKEQSEYVALMKNVASKGADLARDILDVNAFETNEDPYVISQINVLDFLIEKRNEFQDNANQKHIKLKVESIDPKLVLFTEKTHLSRIIDNLISNALKYSDRETIVSINAHQSQGIIKLSVSDQGPGFSEEDQQDLYKKFKKLSARPTDGETSNGLGLAIVKTLTERLKGEISLETSARGSTFIVSLPDLD